MRESRYRPVLLLLMADQRTTATPVSAAEISVVNSIVWYSLAAIAEIAGCFAFWAWLRLDRTPLWLIPGLISLALFAYLLTLVESEQPGRTYAAYGGIYILASVLWLWVVERQIPDRWDVTGSMIALLGAAVILWGPRAV